MEHYIFLCFFFSPLESLSPSGMMRLALMQSSVGQGHLFVLTARLAKTRYNHTESAFIRSLVAPLALDYYWPTLTY